MPGFLRAWEPCAWRGEQAWQENAGPWLAVVSKERGRLIYLGPKEKASEPDQNLLYAPPERDSRTWGGHRFWLGPQSSWPVFWPAPEDWEWSPSSSSRVEGRTLILSMSRRDRRFPPLERAYRWIGMRLILTGRWKEKDETDSNWQGIHILQIPRQALIQCAVEQSPALPLGYALLPISQRPSILLRSEKKSPCLTVESNNKMMSIRHRNQEEKIGLPSRVLTVLSGKKGFRLHPARFAGERRGTTDDALFPTQVYAGDKTNPYLEVEQLSPRLRVPASTSVELEPFFLPGQSQL